MLWDSMRAKRFPPAFIWLPLTTLNSHDYVDHHLLFHVLLIPFTWFRDLQTGAKVAAALFATIAVFSCYWLVVCYEIRYRLIWLIALLACSAPFLYRLNMTKAPPFAIIFLVTGAYLLFERKFWPRSEEHTSELQSLAYLVCRLLLEKKKFLIVIYLVITFIVNSEFSLF